MTSTDTFQRPHFPAYRTSAHPLCCQRALLVNERTHKMFSTTAIVRTNATIQNPIDRVINAGLIALVGGSVAAALAVGVPMSAAGTQAAMPTSQWRSLFKQGVLRASSHEPHERRLVGTANAPVGEGWG